MSLPEPYYVDPASGITIYCGDALRFLQECGTVDLIFADPPFNVGVDYGSGRDADRLLRDRYLSWVQTWCDMCSRVLCPTGALWLAINDESVAEFKGISERLGFTLRNWIIWYYAFGQHSMVKFGRSKTHLLYFCKNRKTRTWNPNAIRIPSARQTQYADKRANPAGRVPGDVWEFPRVCGTFKERMAEHPCQMPVPLLERIILACSNPGDMVLDPFCGSGTTLVAAKRHGRRAIGIEINQEYCKLTAKRLAQGVFDWKEEEAKPCKT